MDELKLKVTGPYRTIALLYIARQILTDLKESVIAKAKCEFAVT